jgi:predicted hotdog family 3-hydroxylacyl-ACP dehydratase
MSEATFLYMPAAETVIPHRGDALLIDRIVAMDGKRLEAALTVRHGTAFSDARGELPAWVAPEIMAQAVAAFAGCRSLQSGGHAVSMGLLLGVRRLELAVEAFRPGEDVRVEVVCTSSDEAGRGVFDCELHTAAGLAAAATLTAFQPQEPVALQSLLAAGCT